MALIRFVNGLVDQLQTGLYARSLSQIANQIGLPLSFVQIRHRATHEDLPSHSILVDSAKMALDWLYNNYWAPTVNEMNGTHSLPDSKGTSHQQQEERLVELLRHYKRLRKRSLIDQTDKEFIRLQSQISDWIRITTKSFIELGISNNRVYSKFLAGKAVDDDEVVVDFEEEMEIRSLNVLCKVLCQSDFFVPKSLLKRNQLINSFLLPRHLKELYEPLINFIDQLYSKRASISFKKLLISKILEIILVDRVKTIEQLRFHKTHRAVDEQDKGLDGGGSSSYVFTISAWLVSILNGLDQFGNGCEPEDNEIQQESLRDHVLKQLILKPNPFTIELIKSINMRKKLMTCSLKPTTNYFNQEEDGQSFERLLDFVSNFFSPSNPEDPRNKKRTRLEEPDESFAGRGCDYYEGQIEKIKQRFDELVRDADQRETIESDKPGYNSENVKNKSTNDLHSNGIDNSNDDGDEGSRSNGKRFRWKLVDEEDWSGCSIGCLPGERLPNLYKSL
ncbi:Las1-like-domain-containing protein [Phakopsora pachyrhizi]|nr:Las1-like-domain-containing protein [Phakopsora pachyrhizi]